MKKNKLLLAIFFSLLFAFVINFLDMPRAYAWFLFDVLTGSAEWENGAPVNKLFWPESLTRDASFIWIYRDKGVYYSFIQPEFNFFNDYNPIPGQTHRYSLLFYRPYDVTPNITNAIYLPTLALPGAFNLNPGSPVCSGGSMLVNNLSWGASSGATGYTIYRNTTPTFVDANIIDKVGAVTSYPDSTNLLPNTTYYYKILATNNQGTTWSTNNVPVLTTNCWDFSLYNSGDVLVQAGQSGSNTITAALITGPTQPISLSVTAGLPSGATTSWPSGGSCNPTCSRPLAVSSSVSTPIGTYNIVVTGNRGGKSRTTQFNLIISTPPPPPPPPDAVIFKGIFVGNAISLLRNQLTIEYDSQTAKNPPPGFTELLSPLFREVAP